MKKDDDEKKKQRDLFDGVSARRERDLGMNKLKEKNKAWLRAAVERFPEIPMEEVTGEDIRVWLKSLRVEEPTHHNTWGVLTQKLSGKGLLEFTGRTVKGCMPLGHARRLPVWKVCLPKKTEEETEWQ